VALFAKVIDLSMVDDAFHVAEFVLEPAAAGVAIAVAFVDPAATAAANDAKSEISADLMAIASPAETDDDVIDTFVWLAMLSRPVNRLFHDDAVIVPPAETVAIEDWFRPYSLAPAPAK
jgi:hypothetical protein